MRSPAQIRQFLDENLWRFDLGTQYLGDEPNVVFKDWDTCSVRTLMVASWAYEQAAGNQSIPAVYKAINIAREDFLCDRFYLPATPRDMRLLEKNGIPVFGIESKHAMTDFDVVGTSISYPVLAMSFVKMLSMSGVPVRWRERSGTDPFVLVGGQAYAAPEVLAPVVDAFYLGEAEDEQGNPGIGRVMERISQYKQEGRWSTDRVGCYEAMAREFPYLYFPRFVEVIYDYQDRSHVGLEKPSKQVVGYRSLLEGMRMPFERHYVRDLDAIPPLDDAPLLYTDAGNASGDIEVARGCPAWSIPVDAQVEIAGRGSVRFDSVQPGERIRVGDEYRQIAGVVVHGWKDTVRVRTRQGVDLRCTPEHEVLTVLGGKALSRVARDTAERVWVHAEDLQPGDLLLRTCGGVEWSVEEVEISHQCREHRVGQGRALRYYADLWPTRLDSDIAWLLGMVTGDCIIRKNQVEFRVDDHAPAVREFLVEILKARFDIDVTEVSALSARCTHIRANSARLVVWLKANFGLSHSKHERKIVPGQLFRSPRDVVGAYLSALYDSNGTCLIPKSPQAATTIRFVSYSEAQVRDVAELLRMLGLPCGIRFEERNVKRDGSPSQGASVKWEVRTAGADDPRAYSWLVSREPFKSRHLEQFRPPQSRAACQQNLQYVEVVSVDPDDPCQVMDVDVPGPQAFNVAGIYVHNCSFCRLSWVTKPYRQRSVDYMVEFGKNLKRNMGGTHVAYVAPDFPMHTEKKRLTKALVENVTDEVDGAAMRIDDFIADDQFVTLSSYAGMDGVTLGLEGNSQRMRDLVGKGVSDAETREAVRRALEAGVRKVKLFMISNMPGEDEGDIERIVQLARDLAEIRDSMGKSNVVIQFSWTPLLIEANTPFQWFAPTPANYHLSHMWDAMRDLKIDFKIGDLDCRELVLTPDRGWVPIGELRVGDAVVDPEGESSEVTGVYPQGVNQTYAVRLVDGTEVVASGNHLWDVAWGSGKGRVLRTLTTLQLKEHLETRSQVPEVVSAPGLATQSLGPGDGRVDPYLLGLLLGDGCFTKTSPEYASADPELIQACGDLLPTGLKCAVDFQKGDLVSVRIVQEDGGGNNYPRRENPLTGFLRDVGLWGLRAHEKFVPDTFKWASAQDRLAVLQGLMDTDGGINRGSAVFSSASEQLRDDVLWLARSLGLVARGSDHATWYSYKGEKRDGRRGYKARVWWSADVPVFRLARKANHPVPKPLIRKLKSIEPVEEAPTVCISVSAKSERFVASSGFVPTHNSKSEVNKVTFFQLCQRASREIGEVLVDTMLELNVACWGGVPKSTRDLLDANMVKHGFLNGLEDAFDERGKDDLFGWEFISTGVSQSLLWDVYQQMVEFLEITDSTTYDEQFEGSEYHGAEWLSRCDERCLGKACGACTREDLEIRKQYTAADDESIDLSTVDAIDERSVAVKVRARLDKSEAYRLVTNDHWRFTLRRALYRAQEATDLPANIVKRSIVFASDAIGFKDWTHGTDYVEFALTKPVSSQALEKFLAAVEEELVSPTGQPWMQVGLWKIHPPTAGSIRADLDLTLYEVEVEEELSTLQARLRWWDEQESVDMTIRAPVTYFGPTMETVNAKEYVDGLWLAREGHRVVVRMLVRGRPSPYNVLAAFLGNPSWLEYARFPARRVDSFVQWETDQWDFFFPACQQCGVTIPVNVLEESFDTAHCPRCKDESEGRLIPV